MKFKVSNEILLIFQGPHGDIGLPGIKNKAAVDHSNFQPIVPSLPINIPSTKSLKRNFDKMQIGVTDNAAKSPIGKLITFTHFSFFILLSTHFVI